MVRVEGSAEVKLIECTNPVRNKWRVRWDVQPTENGNASYMEAEFDYKPTTQEIRSWWNSWYNDLAKEKILKGMTYEGNPVWLSIENQLNYQNAYDRAVRSNGASLPVVFKLGTDEEPVYREFTKLDELVAFQDAIADHISQVINETWKLKDAFKPEDYKIKE